MVGEPIKLVGGHWPLMTPMAPYHEKYQGTRQCDQNLYTFATSENNMVIFTSIRQGLTRFMKRFQRIITGTTWVVYIQLKEQGPRMRSKDSNVL